jgi:hypothetical protein
MLPSARRQGVAALPLQNAETLAKAAGKTLLVLDTVTGGMPNDCTNGWAGRRWE